MGAWREFEALELEKVITAVIAAYRNEDDLDIEHLKTRIAELRLDELLFWMYEFELTDELIEKCLERVKEFY
ncbi:MAG: hypothetical protein IJ757_00525 [Clostridiales bacterium]|nr:hypothetical protein [Clostridiales bacterium]